MLSALGDIGGLADSLAEMMRNPRHIHALKFCTHVLLKSHRIRQSNCVALWRRRKASSKTGAVMLRLLRQHKMLSYKQRCFYIWRTQQYEATIVSQSARHRVDLVHLQLYFLQSRILSTAQHKVQDRIAALTQTSRISAAAEQMATHRMMVDKIRCWHENVVTGELASARREIVCLSNQIEEQGRGVKMLEVMYSLPPMEASIVLLIVEKLKGSRHHTSESDWESILATLKGKEAEHVCPERPAITEVDENDELEYTWAAYRCSVEGSREQIIHQTLRRSLMAFAFNLICKRLTPVHYIYEEKYFLPEEDTEVERAKHAALVLEDAKRQDVRDKAHRSVEHDVKQKAVRAQEAAAKEAEQTALVDELQKKVKAAEQKLREAKRVIVPVDEDDSMTAQGEYIRMMKSKIRQKDTERQR